MSTASSRRTSKLQDCNGASASEQPSQSKRQSQGRLTGSPHSTSAGTSASVFSLLATQRRPNNHTEFQRALQCPCRCCRDSRKPVVWLATDDHWTWQICWPVLHPPWHEHKQGIKASQARSARRTASQEYCRPAGYFGNLRMQLPARSFPCSPPFPAMPSLMSPPSVSGQHRRHAAHFWICPVGECTAAGHCRLA